MRKLLFMLCISAIVAFMGINVSKTSVNRLLTENVEALVDQEYLGNGYWAVTRNIGEYISYNSSNPRGYMKLVYDGDLKLNDIPYCNTSANPHISGVKGVCWIILYDPD